MAQPSDRPGGRRLALVVATMRYQDASLTQLRAPARDAEDLTRVLSDPHIGGFAVTAVLDKSIHDIRVAIEDFIGAARSDDLILMYLSGHGIKDKRGRLYFAGTDTRKALLGATGLEASWLLDQLDDCGARSQVVILDCCFSGAFAQGAKGGDADVELERHFPVNARGRVVLTASRGTEYSFEGEPLSADVRGSVFTSGLIEGLRSGRADIHRTGVVSVERAFHYAYDYVKDRGNAQHPQIWRFGGEGDIILGHSRVIVEPGPSSAPHEFRPAPVESTPDPAVAEPDPLRDEALQLLTGLLDEIGSSTDRKYLARQADSSSPTLAAAAKARLAALDQAAPPVAAPARRPSARPPSGPVSPAAGATAVTDREELKKLIKRFRPDADLRCPACGNSVRRINFIQHVDRTHDLAQLAVNAIEQLGVRPLPPQKRRTPTDVAPQGALRRLAASLGLTRPSQPVAPPIQGTSGRSLRAPLGDREAIKRFIRQNRTAERMQCGNCGVEMRTVHLVQHHDRQHGGLGRRP